MQSKRFEIIPAGGEETTHGVVMQDPETGKAKNPISLKELFWVFFRIGLFTFGGGLAMSPVIRYELVVKRRWLEDSGFISAMSMAAVVPGGIAVNIAYLAGRKLRGKTGSAAAVLGTILPSFFVILLVAGFLWPVFNYPKAAAFFRGCAVAVAGQLAFAGFIFGRKLLRKWQHFAVCAAGVITIVVFGMHPIWGLIAASVCGYWLCPGVNPKGVHGDPGAV